MFRMNKETKEKLEGGTLNKRQMAYAKRQLVYQCILNSNPRTNKELAEAAGYDMSDWYSDDYAKGAAFISNLIRDGYIEKTLGKDGEIYFYIGSKESVEADAPVTTTPIESEEDEDEMMGPEGQCKEDWEDEEIEDDFCGEDEFVKLFNGSITISDPNDPEIRLTLEFKNQTHCDIVNLMENLNMEDLI